MSMKLSVNGQIEVTIPNQAGYIDEITEKIFPCKPKLKAKICMVKLDDLTVKCADGSTIKFAPMMASLLINAEILPNCDGENVTFFTVEKADNPTIIEAPQL